LGNDKRKFVFFAGVESFDGRLQVSVCHVLVAFLVDVIVVLLYGKFCSAVVSQEFSDRISSLSVKDQGVLQVLVGELSFSESVLILN